MTAQTCWSRQQCAQLASGLLCPACMQLLLLHAQNAGPGSRAHGFQTNSPFCLMQLQLLWHSGHAGPGSRAHGSQRDSPVLPHAAATAQACWSGQRCALLAGGLQRPAPCSCDHAGMQVQASTRPAQRAAMQPVTLHILRPKSSTILVRSPTHIDGITSYSDTVILPAPALTGIFFSTAVMSDSRRRSAAFGPSCMASA